MSPTTGGQTTQLPHILLAEDDADLRHLLASALRKHHEVTEARTGHELLARVHQSLTGLPAPCSFDLLITDYRMPGASGLEALAALAAAGKAHRVILISAFMDDVLQRRARQLGVGLLLAKPFAITALLDAVGCLLGQLPPREEEI